MPDKELWVASIKAKALENCELNDDGSEFQFVECLYLADGDDQIIAELKKKLPELHLELSDVLMCCFYRAEDWHSDDDPLVFELIQDAADKAIERNELVFGPFTSSEFLNGRD